MFKNFYTTQMSSDSKMLKNRFEKMNIKSGKKITTAFVTLVLLTAAIFTTMAFAAVDGIENYTAEIMVNGEKTELMNKPFFENNTVYVPLRELFNKLGVMDNEESRIDWDNGKITVQIAKTDEVPEYVERDEKTVNFIYNYGIEINKPEIVLNPTGTLSEQYAEWSNISEATKSAPVLINNTTYIPFEYLRTLLKYNGYSVSAVVYGKGGEVQYVESMADRKNLKISYPCESEGNISSSYGTRIHPLTGEKIIHSGVDIASEKGTAVYASVSGKILKSEFEAEKGNYIVLSDENGIEIMYAHLESALVKAGDYVERGQKIAATGATGMATGPHLHFEMKIDGETVNPLLYCEK